MALRTYIRVIVVLLLCTGTFNNSGLENIHLCDRRSTVVNLVNNSDLENIHSCDSSSIVVN